jgi:hypothetical protein
MASPTSNDRHVTLYYNENPTLGNKRKRNSTPQQPTSHLFNDFLKPVKAPTIKIPPLKKRKISHLTAKDKIERKKTLNRVDSRNRREKKKAEVLHYESLSNKLTKKNSEFIEKTKNLETTLIKVKIENVSLKSENAHLKEMLTQKNPILNNKSAFFKPHQLTLKSYQDNEKVAVSQTDPSLYPIFQNSLEPSLFPYIEGTDPLDLYISIDAFASDLF